YHKRTEQLQQHPVILQQSEEIFLNPPYEYKRRETFEIKNIGGHNVPRVIIDLSTINNVDPLHLKAVDMHYDAASDKWNMGEQASDYLYFGRQKPGFMLP